MLNYSDKTNLKFQINFNYFASRIGIENFSFDFVNKRNQCFEHGCQMISTRLP